MDEPEIKITQLVCGDIQAAINRCAVTAQGKQGPQHLHGGR